MNQKLPLTPRSSKHPQYEQRTKCRGGHFQKGSHLLAEDTKVEDKVIREISETSTGVDEGSDAAAGL